MKKINHYVVEIIYTMIPTYITYDSCSRLVFLSGEKTQDIFDNFKVKIKDLPRESQYELDFRINMYVLSPDGEYKLFNGDDKDLLKIHEIFLKHFQKES